MPPPPMRSVPLVKHIEMGKMDILTSIVLCLCLTVFITSNIDLYIRYIPFNTSLNTLTVSRKAKHNKICTFHYFSYHIL